MKKRKTEMEKEIYERDYGELLRNEYAELKAEERNFFEIATEIEKIPEADFVIGITSVGSSSPFLYNTRLQKELLGIDTAN